MKLMVKCWKDKKRFLMLASSSTQSSNLIITLRKSARKLLITGVGKNFKNPETMKLLYCCLVRSNLEYAYVIWNPSTTHQIEQLETIQHKFLKFMAGNFYGDKKHNIDYQKYEKTMNLETLELRIVKADVKFTFNSFNDEVDSQTFNLNVPERATRNFQVFRTNSSKKETGASTVMNRLVTSFHKFCGDADLLHHRKCLRCITSITKAKFITQSLFKNL